MTDILTNWRFWSVIVGAISLITNVCIILLGRYVANKIMNNDLHHIKLDIDELKQENKDYKIDLKKDLTNILEKVDKIEKAQAVRDALCNLRHKQEV